MTTAYERMLVQALGRELGGEVPTETVERLFELGLADIRACERRAVQAEIARRTAQGMPRCEAMEAVAVEFHCSYGKIRRLVYER